MYCAALTNTIGLFGDEYFTLKQIEGSLGYYLSPALIQTYFRLCLY